MKDFLCVTTVYVRLRSCITIGDEVCFSLSIALRTCSCPKNLHTLPFDPADFSYFEPRCECCYEGGCLCPLANSTAYTEFEDILGEYSAQKALDIMKKNHTDFTIRIERLNVSNHANVSG